MSTSSAGSKGISNRVEHLQKSGRLSRHSSSSQNSAVTRYDAYTFSLRVAYLTYLLQPRTRRLQHAPAKQRPNLQRHATPVTDLVKDFSQVRDSKHTRFPHGFMSELDRRIEGVLQGQEKRLEFDDPMVKRSFAAFLNEFRRPEFRKSMEKDRRIEDLLLIFFSNATKELSEGKALGDDNWKLMVDRHVALFVRLISSTLKGNDGFRGKPELSVRLQTLENKLLMHDQDLSDMSQRNGGAGGTTKEIEVPKSHAVKDMPLVLTVADIFGKSTTQVQLDIDEQKDLWTDKAALHDLKMYQNNLMLNNKRTLRSDDFDTEEAYSVWKKTETQELSHLMLEILQSNPELAKSTPGVIPQLKHTTNGSTSEVNYAELSRTLSGPEKPYIVDQPVDMSMLSLNGQNGDFHDLDDSDSYIFIPSQPRTYYRFIVKEALSHDMRNENVVSPDSVSQRLLSKRSVELLSDIGVRWRIPHISRMMLFLDVIKEMFIEHEIGLDTLDAAFTYVKQLPAKNKQADERSVADPTKWTIADYVLKQQVLASIHDTLLRDLFVQLERCYRSRPPDVGAIMTVLEVHIYDDPMFSKTPETLDRFSEELKDALRRDALSLYSDLFDEEIGQHLAHLEFHHVIQLGKAVLKLSEKIQKRYRKTSQIMGVDPFIILVETILPSYASDARDQITNILEKAKQHSEEIPVQDGFDLYKEMVEIRRVSLEALPGVRFGFDIESTLATFVWRWIDLTGDKIPVWVDEAVKQDLFEISAKNGQTTGNDQRHSVSVIDIFHSFNEAVEQIVKLEWDDDLQYAKFMTTLSRALGTGLGRYCELLEQMFNKEMDRVTPEQQASSAQTRQQKWVQMAKDTIANTQKAEPFQFLPQSFVKLNNIEYAMLRLDKLEKEMNADACAAVIQAYEPPPTPTQRKRKAETNIFTIKIMEAEDLKACDANGLSDPYVVLGDEYQKRLAKTRIVYGSLNPRWDETVDIKTQGPLNIIATIWDWDAMGDHDCVGRTSLKLDPSHFRDFLPREYWLDLDTQGRLLVRVSMEGEKDDIQFYFGKTFRALKRTERDMTRKISDKLSAYIHQCLSRRTLRGLTAKGITLTTVSNYFQRNRPPASVAPSTDDITNALKPLFTYFNDNFAIMKQTLTPNAMVSVMTRLWKEVLSTIESLLVPPLSDKPSQQRQLSEQELDIVFKWLQMLFDFFHAVDDETGIAHGIPIDILKSPKYHDVKNVFFFYFEPTDTLIRTSERMAVATGDRQREAQTQANRLSAPAALSGPVFGAAGGVFGIPTTRRSKSIMLSRNLGTMKKAKADKRKEAQAEPKDDMILRILRMRPEAENYLRDRSRQRERLAAAAAAEMIVRQSMAAGMVRDRSGR